MNKIVNVWLWVMLAFVFSACHPENDVNNAKLAFSTPKLSFDTVFTTVGSTTKHFMVYNNNSFDLSFDVLLAGGKSSNFSINVDGMSGTSFQNVLIPAHDSLFVHVKVNVDPGNQNTPFLITDSVVFYVGENRQDVDLIAYGQDANFIVADQNLSSSLPYKIVAKEHEVVHWTNDKPYVIYGWAAVDSLGTLIIDPGTRIYFHSNAGLWIYRYGNLQVNGTAEAPVYFRGDRKEAWYDTDYAQWNRIWINEGTKDNVINYAVISNAYIGIQSESLEEYLGNKTIITNSIIQNTANSGVLARATKLEMANCQISNNGTCCAQLEIGTFDLKHVTMANYFSQQVRKYPALYISNGYKTSDNEGNSVSIVGNTSASIVNSIAYGSLKSEVITQNYSTEQMPLDFNVTFENSLFRMLDEKELEATHFYCLINKDPLFKNPVKQDFMLKENSPAIDAGKSIGIPLDLSGHARDQKPDIGAFEYSVAPSLFKF